MALRGVILGNASCGLGSRRDEMEGHRKEGKEEKEEKEEKEDVAFKIKGHGSRLLATFRRYLSR